MMVPMVVPMALMEAVGGDDGAVGADGAVRCKWLVMMVPTKRMHLITLAMLIQWMGR